MVFLDVVYNHFGPEGNYLPSYSPVLTDRHKTPWGPAINYDAEGSEVVRDLIIANALYWIHEYRIDGLRLDAIHAICRSMRKVPRPIASAPLPAGTSLHCCSSL